MTERADVLALLTQFLLRAMAWGWSCWPSWLAAVPQANPNAVIHERRQVRAILVRART
jgi:hypothetical protein